MEPITFTPLYMQRVWGGRELETVYHRTLPDAQAPYGESWEIVDREEAQSIVDQGPMAGMSLHDLWSTKREELFGCGYEESGRFPILIKVLDARDDLSIQVHPPVHLAASLEGEPKTEMWVIAGADPGAKLYVGLKNGVTREDFEKSIATGTVEQCVHSITPKVGDSIFIPSGRLHAIGAGFLIHEIQQNSDTTYRVFDWNRCGLDGKPRDLHVAKSMASIDFTDIEPGMDRPRGENLASCKWFSTDRVNVAAGGELAIPNRDVFCIVSILRGQMRSAGGREFGEGSFLLLPRGCTPVLATTASTVLRISLPR